MHVTVYWPDGREVSAGWSWEGARGRFDSVDLPKGRYKVVVSGYHRRDDGTIDDYGEVTVFVDHPGEEITVRLPK